MKVKDDGRSPDLVSINNLIDYFNQALQAAGVKANGTSYLPQIQTKIQGEALERKNSIEYKVTSKLHHMV